MKSSNESTKESTSKPIIGITLGDCAGIGGEITAKMLADKEVYYICNPVVIGDADVMQDGIRIAGLEKKLKLNTIPSSLDHTFTREDILGKAKFEPGSIDLIDLDNITLTDFEYGKVSRASGRASGDFIKKSIDLSLANAIDAVVTNAIHKEAFTLGGYGKAFPGHTEMFAHYTNTTKYSMMLGHENLRVFHVTTHIPLMKVAENLSIKRIYDVIELAYNTCRQIGIERPRIGVAGLNPHSSDGGKFGNEEREIINPAVIQANQKGIRTEGSVPPDTLFCKAKGGMYDAVVVMYHDQGHIPVKQAGFHLINPETREYVMRGINATLGLNKGVIRVSVDHGTAYGKAGKGRADYGSLRDALDYAVLMAKNKIKN